MSIASPVWPRQPSIKRVKLDAKLRNAIPASGSESRCCLRHQASALNSIFDCATLNFTTLCYVTPDTMAPPTLDIEPLRAEILEWHNEGLTMGAIVDKIQETSGLQISVPTLKRRFNNWGMTSHKIQIANQNPDRLYNRVAECFALRMTDAQTLKLLEEEGWDLSLRTLRRVRVRLGLRKIIFAGQEEEKLREIRDALQKEYDEGLLDNIEHLSSETLYSYMRSKYNIVGRSVTICGCCGCVGMLN